MWLRKKKLVKMSTILPSTHAPLDPTAFRRGLLSLEIREKPTSSNGAKVENFNAPKHCRTTHLIRDLTKGQDCFSRKTFVKKQCFEKT